GTDTFRYIITDDNGGVSLPGTVTVITQIPSAPALSVTLKESQAVGINALAFATDPAGSSALLVRTLQGPRPPEHGIVLVNSHTGRIIYVPAAGYSGSDSFLYTITDRKGATSKPILVDLSIL